MSPVRPLLIVLALLVSASQAACADPVEPAAGSAAESTTSKADGSAEAAQEAEAGATSETSTSSEVMRQPLDGTDDETWEASIARVKAEATEEEFVELRRALGMLQTYDMAIRSNPGQMRVRLNGQTPEQVILAVRERW